MKTYTTGQFFTTITMIYSIRGLHAIHYEAL